MSLIRPAAEPRRHWRQILENSSWYVSEKVLRMVAALLVSAWVARYLGPVQYGALAFATALVTMLAFLGSLGVESLVVRDFVQHPGRSKQIISSYFLIRLLGAVLVPIAANGYVLFLHPDEPLLLIVTAILSTGVLFSSLDVADCLLQARHEARTTSMVRIGALLISAATKIGLVLAGAPLPWFAGAAILETLLVAVAYWRVLARRDLMPDVHAVDRHELTTLFVDGRFMILSGLAVVVYSKIDVLLVGELLPSDVLGSYAVALMMCGAWNMVGMSMSQAVAPHVSRARDSSPAEYRTILRHFLLMMGGISILGSAALSAVAPWVFGVLLGPAFSPGAEIFAIVVWSSVPVFLGVATSQLIVNERMYGLSLARTAAGMVCTLTLVVPLAERFGVLGVAWLVVGSASLATFTMLASERARELLTSVFRFT